MLRKGSFHVVFSLVFVFGLAHCAYQDAQEVLVVNEGEQLVQKIIISQRSDDFGEGRDCDGKQKSSEAFVSAPKFLNAIKLYDRVSFSDVEAIAKSIFGFQGRANIWIKIINALCKDRTIEMDFVQQCFVTGKNVEEPKERVESAIVRLSKRGIYSNPRNMILVLCSLGYRGLSYHVLSSKIFALIGAGFCDVGGKISVMQKRMRVRWNNIKFEAHEEAVKHYHGACAEDARAVYQMLYMREHRIIDELKKVVNCDDDEGFDFERRRQDAILRYLQEQKRPCSPSELMDGVGASCVTVGGVFYDVAHLMYSGHRIIYDWDDKTFEIKPGGMPSQQARSVERVLIQNACLYKSAGEAIIATYMQGYRDYPPDKMLLIHRACDTMGFFSTVLDDRHRALFHFLQKIQQIPSIWDWDETWSKEGEELLLLYNHSELQVLFDLHNKRALKGLQECAMGYLPKQFFPAPLFDDKDHGSCPVAPATFEGATSELHAQKPGCGYKRRKDFDASDYTLSEIDVEDNFEKAQIAICIVRNCFPTMGLKRIQKILCHNGISCVDSQARDIFQALAVARLMPRLEKDSDAVLQNRGFFTAAINGYNLLNKSKSMVMRERSLCTRDRRVVALACRMKQDERLKKYAGKASENIKITIREGSCFFKKRVEKKRIMQKVVSLHDQEGAKGSDVPPRVHDSAHGVCGQTDGDKALIKKALKHIKGMHVANEAEEEQMAVGYVANLYPEKGMEDLTDILNDAGWAITPYKVREIVNALYIAKLVQGKFGWETDLVKGCRVLFKKAKDNHGSIPVRNGRNVKSSDRRIVQAALSMDKNERLKKFAFGTPEDVRKRILSEPTPVEDPPALPQQQSDCGGAALRKRAHVGEGFLLDPPCVKKPRVGSGIEALLSAVCYIEKDN